MVFKVQLIHDYTDNTIHVILWNWKCLWNHEQSKNFLVFF